MSTNFPTGLDTFVNPNSGTPINGAASPPALVHSTQHINVNDALRAVEAKIGVDFSSVTTSLDFITSILLMTHGEHHKAVLREIVGGHFPTTVTWYGNMGKTIKLIEKTYSYDDFRNISSVTIRLFDGTASNILKRTITDNITRSGPFEVSRTRSIA